MEVTTIKIKKLNDNFAMPQKATEGSAAYDAILGKDHNIQYGRQIIPLGFAIEMPQNIAMDVRPRSGYSAKGLKVFTKQGNEVRINADVCLGLVDSDYRGEIGVILNVKEKLAQCSEFHVKAGDAIAQLCFHEVAPTTLELSDELSETSRGDKGFGQANNE